MLTGAELLTAEMEQRIIDAWGRRPVQVYATTEAPIVAAGGLEHRELRIFEDLVWIEVVDEQNRPVPAGTPGYKVLLTNLVNYAKPLIRYELTDAITLAPNGGIASIDGRSDDTLLLPGENGKPVTVPPFRLRAPFTSLKDVRACPLRPRWRQHRRARRAPAELPAQHARAGSPGTSRDARCGRSCSAPAGDGGGGDRARGARRQSEADQAGRPTRGRLGRAFFAGLVAAVELHDPLGVVLAVRRE